MKRLSAVLLSALLCLSLIFCVSAAEDPDRMVDNADILTSEEQAELTAILDRISDEQNFDVVIVTTTDLNGQEIYEYAEDFYDAGGYRKNGIIMVRLAGDAPRYDCTLRGKGNQIFDEDAQNDIRFSVEQYLRADEPFEAFRAFAEVCEEKVDSYVPEFIVPLLICIGIGILLAFLIPMSILKGQLKSVRSQPAASSYVRPGSMNLTNQRDIYLYRTLTRTAKPKENSGSSGGGSGGSSGTTSRGNTHFGGSC